VTLPVRGVQFSDAELVRRLQVYEREAHDLGALCICIASWGGPQDASILQKILARLTDNMGPQAGLRGWLSLRWHPILVLTYSAGISALASKRLDNLLALLGASAQSPETAGKRTSLLEAVGEAILEFHRLEIFKRLPEHARQYVPRSEYMHKLLQPGLEELLGLGAEYEGLFDRLEVLLALGYADARAAVGDDMWGPIGRYGWKAHHPKGYSDPMSAVVAQEKNSGALIRAGFFGGDVGRFDAAAEWLRGTVSSLEWF